MHIYGHSIEPNRTRRQENKRWNYLSNVGALGFVQQSFVLAYFMLFNFGASFRPTTILASYVWALIVSETFYFRINYTKRPNQSGTLNKLAIAIIIQPQEF